MWLETLTWKQTVNEHVVQVHSACSPVHVVQVPDRLPVIAGCRTFNFGVYLVNTNSIFFSIEVSIAIILRLILRLKMFKFRLFKSRRKSTLCKDEKQPGIRGPRFNIR